MPVDVSTQQMALTQQAGPGGFMERVTAMLAFQCATVLGEPGTTPYHPSRAYYAQTVVRNPQQAATQAGPQVVMNVNVVQTTTYDEATKTSICTIADIDLQATIASLWNSLGGVDAPS